MFYGVYSFHPSIRSPLLSVYFHLCVCQHFMYILYSPNKFRFIVCVALTSLLPFVIIFTKLNNANDRARGVTFISKTPVNYSPTDSGIGENPELTQLIMFRTPLMNVFVRALKKKTFTGQQKSTNTQQQSQQQQPNEINCDDGQRQTRIIDKNRQNTNKKPSNEMPFL